MRTIIAGSRPLAVLPQDIFNEIVDDLCNEYNLNITTILEGECDGIYVEEKYCSSIDEKGRAYAKLYNLSCEEYPADWNTYGKSAGPIRNQKMGETADLLIAFWDGKSRGTKNMIDIMTQNSKMFVLVQFYPGWEICIADKEKLFKKIGFFRSNNLIDENA